LEDEALVKLQVFLQHLDRQLREQPAHHPAGVCLDLARGAGVTVEFAGPQGQTLDRAAFERWQRSGGPDPFIDGEGRATLRIQASHRISDWVVLNARLTPRGLVVDRRFTMLRSWVTDS